MPQTARELSAQALCRRCDLSRFDFETTGDLSPLSDFVGQQRAMRAVEFGAGIASHGFNIYAQGMPGSGKTTLIRKFLEQIAANEPTPDDWCYLNNFDDRHKPRALRLPAGQGMALRDDMNALIDLCRQDISRAFESEEYQQEQERVSSSYQEQQEEELEALQKHLGGHNFALLKVPGGLVLTPSIEGRPLQENELEQLGEEEKEKVQKLRKKLERVVERGLSRLREMEEAMRKELCLLDEQTTLRVIGHLIQEARQKYAAFPQVTAYLDEVQMDIIDNIDDFRGEKEHEHNSSAMGAPQPLSSSPFSRYEVNVLIDHANTQGAPVIVESNPTYHNLIGRIEHHAFMGSVATDFTLIKPGALQRANGGYLVLPVREVLINTLSWEALKRSLKDRHVRIEELGTQLSLVSTVTLEPETIPLDVKIVLIGNPMLYYLLHAHDEDFQKLFKVKADFAITMDRTPETERQYALYVRTICEDDDLCPFDRGAVARVIEHSSRLVEHQDKLYTRFGEIADLLREANFWAARRRADAPKDGNPDTVTAADVDRAIREKVFRSNLIEERIQEAIVDDVLRIDSTGEVVGQVNGLSVIGIGDYAFGQPSRVTANTYAGKAGVMNIEREVELSGPIHSKGVLILTSFLGHKYAQDAPLALSASLVFEQSYSGIEGDSASSTELYALLSSLSGYPINQEIAVTGSVDQHGWVQPIGGVNQKIEGFFAVCQARGLTGTQGVIIPKVNTQNLMLRQDVIDAVERGEFHIWPVRTIDEGIALLTGREAGEADEEGLYPPGTVNQAVADRLAAMAETLQGEEEEEKG